MNSYEFPWIKLSSLQLYDNKESNWKQDDKLLLAKSNTLIKHPEQNKYISVKWGNLHQKQNFTKKKTKIGSPWRAVKRTSGCQPVKHWEMVGLKNILQLKLLVQNPMRVSTSVSHNDYRFKLLIDTLLRVDSERIILKLKRHTIW